jgi:PAS domain S-box-containing protein
MDKDQTRMVSAGGEETKAANGAFFTMDSEAFQRMYKDHGAVMYIVDLQTFRIVDANKSALKFYGYDIDTMRTKRIPDINITPEEEIRAEIKRAVEEGRSHYVYQHQLANGEIRDVEISANPIVIKDKEYSFSIVHDITARRIAEEMLKQKEVERERLIAELQEALAEVKTLNGLFPICASCKKIRDDKGYWNQIESYIQDHSDAKFSHGLCPECTDGLYGHKEWYIKMKKKKGTE